MKNIVKSVMVVTLFGVATKALGLLIKIYISREIGAEALGFYQIASSVFFLLCALVTSGLPLVISRRVSARPTEEPALVSSGLLISVLISGAVTAIIIFFPSVLSALLNQHQSIIVLFTLLPALISTAFYTPFRGAFWGRKDFFTISFVEFLEQIIRLFSCIVLFNIGIISLSGEQIVGVTTSIACIISSVYAIVYYFCHRGKLSSSLRPTVPLIKESLPIAFVRISTSVISMLIAIILPAQMVSYGHSMTDAVSSFGVVSGMILPLLTVSGTIIGSIAVILVPELGSATKEPTKDAKSKINSSLSVSIILSLFLFPMFFGIGKEIGVFLFQNTLAGDLLQAGSFLLLPLGLSQISTSILNALGYEKRTLVYYLIGTAFMLLSIIFLPKYIGIYSLLLGMLGMSIITATLNLLFLRKYLNIVPLRTLFIASLICFPCVLMAKFTENILSFYASSFICIGIASVLSVLSFGVLCVCFNLFDITAVLPAKFSKKLKPKKV